MRHELPGVGRNLQDHIDFVLVWKSKRTDVFGIGLREPEQLLERLRRVGVARNVEISAADGACTGRIGCRRGQPGKGQQRAGQDHVRFVVGVGLEHEHLVVDFEVHRETRIAHPNCDRLAVEPPCRLARRRDLTDVPVEDPGKRSEQRLERIHGGCLDAIADVQRHDSAHGVVIAAAIEPGVLHHAEQFFLVGVHADRLGQVPVTFLVVRDEFAHHGQDLE